MLTLLRKTDTTVKKQLSVSHQVPDKTLRDLDKRWF